MAAVGQNIIQLAQFQPPFAGLPSVLVLIIGFYLSTLFIIFVPLRCRRRLVDDLSWYMGLVAALFDSMKVLSLSLKYYRFSMNQFYLDRLPCSGCSRSSLSPLLAVASTRRPLSSFF